MASLSTYAWQKSKLFLDSVCVSQVTNVIEQKNVSCDQLASPTKINQNKREREHNGITPPEQVRESDRPKKFFFFLFSW